MTFCNVIRHRGGKHAEIFLRSRGGRQEAMPVKHVTAVSGTLRRHPSEFHEIPRFNHHLVEENHEYQAFSFNIQILSNRKPISQSLNQSINRPANPSINQSIDQPIPQSINQSINRPIINQSINRPNRNQSFNQRISQYSNH